MARALLAAQPSRVFHADLVAVVDAGHTGHGQMEEHAHLELVHGVAGAIVMADDVMIAGGDGDIADAARCIIGPREVVDKCLHTALAAGVKVAVVIIPAVGGAIGEKQGVIPPQVEMNHEIDVESGHQRLLGIAPLGNEDTLRVLLVHPLPDCLPQLDVLLLVGVILDQRRCHVDAETVNTHVHPVGHDVLQLLANGLRPGSIDGLLDRVVRVGVDIAIVQCRLELKVVFTVVFCTGSVRHAIAAPSGDGRVMGAVAPFHGPALIIGDGVGPHVVVAILVALALGRSLEPWVLVARVSGNQVQAHLQPPHVGLTHKLPQILVGAESRVDAVKVCHIIAAILPG